LNWTRILTDEFFGSNDPYTGRLINSRWADLELPYVDDDFFNDHGIDPYTTFFPEEEVGWFKKSDAHMHSPYGLLRSPWNYNPSPYLTRYNNVNQLINASSLHKGMYPHSYVYAPSLTSSDCSGFL
jgi:hypothetical protein